MDENMIKYIADFLSKFYIWEIIIILLAILLTAFIKLPIKKKAIKLEKELGVDKSMLTWVSALIPYFLCLIMVFVLFWYKAGWGKVASLEYSGIITEGLLLGSGAIGLYEAVKKMIKGHKAIKEKKELKEEKEALEAEQKASPFRVINKEVKK